MAMKNALLTAMDAEQFPTFEQSGFYKQWRQAELAGMFTSEESKAECLRMALGIYRRVKADWESDQRQARDGGGLGLAS